APQVQVPAGPAEGLPPPPPLDEMPAPTAPTPQPRAPPPPARPPGPRPSGKPGAPPGSAPIARAGVRTPRPRRPPPGRPPRPERPLAGRAERHGAGGRAEPAVPLGDQRCGRVEPAGRATPMLAAGPGGPRDERTVDRPRERLDRHLPVGQCPVRQRERRRE